MTHEEECSLLREEYEIHEAMKRYAARKRRGEGLHVWGGPEPSCRMASREIVLPTGEVIPIDPLDPSALDILCDVEMLTQADLERLERAVMGKVQKKRRTK